MGEEQLDLANTTVVDQNKYFKEDCNTHSLISRPSRKIEGPNKMVETMKVLLQIVKTKWLEYLFSNGYQVDSVQG